MGAIELKTEINRYLEEVDEHFLKVVHSMLHTYVVEKKEEIIGYDVEGNPKYASAIRKVYDEEVKNALEKKQYITIDELKEKSPKWLNNTK